MVDTDDVITDIAEEYGKDEAEVEERLQQELDDYLDGFVGSADDIDQMEDYATGIALKAVRAHYNQQTAMRGGGELVEVLAYGNGGFRPWTDRNHEAYKENPPAGYEQPKKTVLIGHGVIQRGDGLGVAAIICDETDGVDLDEAKENLTTENTFSGRFRVSEGKLANTFTLWSTEDTEFMEETESVPTDTETKRKVLAKNADLVELMSITDGLSATEPDSGFALDFGTDIKRIRGQIVDLVPPDPPSRTSGIATLHDDSHLDERDLSDLPLSSENQRTAGLTAWIPQDQVLYGVGSVCDFYGVIEEDREGRITMNVSGIVPLFPRPIGDDDDDGNVRSGSLE